MKGYIIILMKVSNSFGLSKRQKYDTNQNKLHNRLQSWSFKNIGNRLLKTINDKSKSHSPLLICTKKLNKNFRPFRPELRLE